jgi:lipopolysaccharide biosynthesis protein
MLKDHCSKTVPPPPDRRLTIYAHYDPEGDVADYVIFALKALLCVSSRIIFVSDCSLSEIALSKLSGHVYKAIGYQHGEYDFGSYKRGYFFALDNDLLEECDELILINDSCYGPLFDLRSYFNRMRTSEHDYWGITENYYRNRVPNPHLQTFFVVLSKRVVISESFKDFMRSIRAEPSKRDVIDKYEIGLSRALVAAGYTYATVVPRSTRSSNLMLNKWSKLIRCYKCPFLKRSLLTNRFKGWRWPGRLKLIWIVSKYSKYPVNLLRS